MGKVKRIRQKLHNAAKRNKEKEIANAGTEQGMMDCDVMPAPSLPATDPTAMGARGDNLFKDVNINSLDLVRQTLPDFDARSTITSKTFKGMNVTKKEKKKIRHEAWMAKIEHIKTAEKKTKEKKKKVKTTQKAIVGDLDPMLEALPTLELLMKSSSKQSEIESDGAKKNRSTQPEKKRKAQMMKDIGLFQQVLKHPLFMDNERRTITEHLKIAMEKETV